MWVLLGSQKQSPKIVSPAEKKSNASNSTRHVHSCRTVISLYCRIASTVCVFVGKYKSHRIEFEFLRTVYFLNKLSTIAYINIKMVRNNNHISNKFLFDPKWTIYFNRVKKGNQVLIIKNSLKTSLLANCNLIPFVLTSFHISSTAYSVTAFFS